MKKTVALALAAMLIIPGAALAKPAPDGSRPAGKALTKAVTAVKAKTFDAVGAGNTGNPYLKLIPGGKAGKTPLVLDESAAWCPHCVATSWPLAVALSRFGTFHKLGRVDSGTYYKPSDPSEAFHHTKGLSFITATYASSYVRFQDVIMGSNKGKPLGKPTKAQARVIKKFSTLDNLPNLSLGGLYGQTASHFPIVQFLKKQSWNDVATALKHPKSPLAQTIIGQANVLSAAICKATKNKPRSVCKSKGVKAGATVLPKS